MATVRTTAAGRHGGLVVVHAPFGWRRVGRPYNVRPLAAASTRPDDAASKDAHGNDENALPSPLPPAPAPAPNITAPPAVGVRGVPLHPTTVVTGHRRLRVRVLDAAPAAAAAAAAHPA
jgi:hypothetical protein